MFPVPFYGQDDAVKIFQELRHFPEFVKLSHSVFALPFGLAAMILAASGFPDWRTFLLIIGATVTARFAAMAFNRVVDAKYDAANPRTTERHLPSGRMSMFTAWLIVATGAILFMAISVWINHLAGILSPVALLVIFGYSFTKRFTRFSHFFLGAALGLAPLGAWVAVQNSLANFAPWLLALAVICWAAGFDMIYALQDEEFDRTHRLYSMVVNLGPQRTLVLVLVFHLIMFIILIVLGFILELHWSYFAGLLVVFASLCWEHWLMRQLKQGNLEKAFLQANALASFGYLGAMILGVFCKN